MRRHSELGVPLGELSLRDLKTLLPSLIPKENTALLSDFDDTLCSNYTYNSDTKTHWPHIDERILHGVQRMKSPLFIATSRAANEEVVRSACASLIANKDLPIICENGAVLLYPNTGVVITLATEDQLEKMEEIKGKIGILGQEFNGNELLIKRNRTATMELRLQDKTGVGNPSLYGDLAKALLREFDLSTLNLVSSGNSLSIQPEGINKRTGFLHALSIMGLKREDLFIVGLGDAQNDAEIFEESNLSIAVRPGAKNYADILVNEGDQVSLLVMENLQ